METEPDDPGAVEDILETIGDPYARDVLASICQEQQSAQELADQLDQSKQTVYRRLEFLQEQDLITAKNQIASDGNHYRVFKSTFDSVLISVEDDRYDVRVYKQEDLPGRFSDLWDELGQR